MSRRQRRLSDEVNVPEQKARYALVVFGGVFPKKHGAKSHAAPQNALNESTRVGRGVLTAPRLRRRSSETRGGLRTARPTLGPWRIPDSTSSIRDSFFFGPRSSSSLRSRCVRGALRRLVLRCGCRRFVC